MQTFEALGLSEDLVKNLSESSFHTPTEIQRLVIPVLLSKKTDLIGLAHTGTGKTAAFGLPLIDSVDSSPEIQAVILAPTRELTQQITKSLQDFARCKPAISVQAVYGGDSITKQIQSIKKRMPQILVATPGRLMDFLKRKVLVFDHIKTFVLDEADEMLNMGFKEDIYKILSFTHSERNIWLFSATMAADIRAVAKDFMHQPEEFSISHQQQINQDIAHQYCLVNSRDKLMALEMLIDYNPAMYGVVFCRTKRDTQQLSNQLVNSGIKADALHGDLSQSQRDAVMRKFRSRDINLLIATDVAARGLDVADLTHVIHYALPDDLAFYTHRSGRTARAGKMGLSLCIGNANEINKLKRFAAKLKIKLEKVELPTVLELQKTYLQQWQSKVADTTVDDNLSNELFEEVQKFVNQLGIDQFIRKIIAGKLKKYTAVKSGISSGDRTNKSKSERPNRRKNNSHDQIENYGYKDKKQGEKGVGNTRFSINVGLADKVNKRELVDFISDVSNVRQREIANLIMEQKFSYFNVANIEASTFSRKFQGYEISGRNIKVSNERNQRVAKNGKKKKNAIYAR